MKINFKSMRFKVFLRFLMVLIILIFLMWLVEIIFFERIYESIKASRFNKSVNTIVSEYGNYTIEDYINFSQTNDCSIIIFSVADNGSIVYEFNTSRNHINLETEIQLFNMLQNLGSSDSTTYLIPQEDYQTIVSGRALETQNGTVYFYISTTITPVAGIVQIMTFLLLIISVITFVITFFISLSFSNSLSKPITNISEKAKELASGNLDVKFDSTEYAEVEQLSETLNYSIEEIKKSQVIQREVIQNVSHELRTPLTLIKSYTELIKDYSGDDKQKRNKHLEIILEEVTRLQYIINDILDLSKMQANTMQYQKEDFDLSASVKKFAEFYKSKFKDFEFETNIDENLMIFADKKRIEQVITNLVNNAINYSKEDNKKIVISAKKQANGFIKFSVQDFGVGISKEDQKYIFDRHFRATSTKRATTGCGIGLTIVKEILNFHEFDFGVDSEVGVGSTFYVLFPASTAINETATDNSTVT